MLKTCRQYMYRVQNSVFEGELTEKTLQELKTKISRIVDTETDGVRIYVFGSVKYSRVDLIGSVIKNEQMV